jgi:acyl carrier protein
MSRQLADRLAARCATLWNMFGPTETTIWSTVMRVDVGGAGPVPIGRPIANTVCRILDRHGAQQPVGVPGELHIGGAGVARGYLDRPELNAQRFVDDPHSDVPGARLYRTGDLARWRNDGTLEFIGRLDHQVKVRGHRIELGEIEAVLRGHPDIADAVVVVREDQPGDQRIVAYLVAETSDDTGTSDDAGRAAPTTAELRARVNQDVPDYMVPSTFVLLDQFPLTPNRKIDRNALPVPDHADLAAGTEYVEPRTDVEHVVAGMFAAVLVVDRVGAIDNFFELGGHSLLATGLAARIRSVFGVDLDLRRFFQEPTVEGVATQLADSDEERKRIERIAQIELKLAALSPEQVAAMLADRRRERPGGAG